MKWRQVLIAGWVVMRFSPEGVLAELRRNLPDPGRGFVDAVAIRA